MAKRGDIKGQRRRYYQKYKLTERFIQRARRYKTEARRRVGGLPSRHESPSEKFLRKMERQTIRGWAPTRFNEFARVVRRRAEKAYRRAAKICATPRWADRKEIARIYRKARELGLTVDHIVPLKSGLVCGLHCEANLRVLSNEENGRKSNRFWPDMPEILIRPS